MAAFRAIAPIVTLLLGGCAASEAAWPAPAVEARATAPTAFDIHERLELTEDSRDLSPGYTDTLDTLTRALPVKYERGNAFVSLSRDHHFRIGVQLSRPNLVGVGMVSRWQ